MIISIKGVILVALGGMCGSIFRYLINLVLANSNNSTKFPLSTLLVNIIGCFAVGALSSILSRFDTHGSDLKLLLITGLLGGFTTFSAFGLEIALMNKHQQYDLLIIYIFLSFGLGLLAAILGLKLFT